MNSAFQRTFLSAVLIGLIASLLVGLLWLLAPGLLNSWEWSTYDARMRLRGPAPASPAIVLIGRDETSEARFGRGMWDRAQFAQVIEGLGKAGADVVAPDFYFAGTSPPERGGAASDEALIRATRQAGNMVYPQSAPPLLPALGQHARGVGHIVAVSDDDGIYRSLPVFLDVEGRPAPAFGLAIALAFLHVTADQVAMTPGEALVLRNARLPDGAVRTLTFPVDTKGRMLVDYAGRWTDGVFAYFSFVDVFDAIEEGRVDELRKQMGGKIVLILHAAAEGDKRRTPLEATAPGGFIHANVVNTIVTGRSLWSLTPVDAVGITIGMAFLTAGLLVACSGWAGLGWLGALGLGYSALAHGLFVTAGLVLPVLAPLLAVVIVLVIGYLLRFVTEQRGRLWMQRAFSQYLGASVVDRLASDQDALRLGGEEREITIMFADLSGFTKLSTQLAPEELTKMTNRYLGYVVEQVEGTGGYVNQFLGDAVMAMWGAIKDDPQHAVHAVQAGMAAAARIKSEKEKADETGVRSFSIKIGLNSGPAMVGNVGTDQRYNYTAVGETVNLAARLESVPALYGCAVVVGSVTADLVKREFLLRELDAIKVKGKDEPITIYEPLAARAGASDEQAACAQRYADALAHYRARRFTEAASIWEKIARDEQDNPSAKMAERARSFQTNPPAPSWDGVWVLSGK
jgi:adenylate cyclase